MKRIIISLLVSSSVPAVAQTAPPSQIPAQILVSATGSVRTAPDMATIGFTLRGEGATSDEAVTKLRDVAKAMSAGIAGLLGKEKDYHASNLAIAEVRARECDANSYGRERLSTGACAIIGYVATMPMTVDTSRVADAGTLTGLVGRLGGVEARIARFWLRDDSPAHRRALQAALGSARSQAQLIAEGSTARLGPLLRVQDADYQEIAFDAQAADARSNGAPPAPPPPPPPPIRIDLAPEPIQTTVRIMVSYAIER